MKNNIKKIRDLQGLTQRQLANLVGTSQQQIQRIETGKIAARIELALSISQALGKPLEKVFPKAPVVIKKLQNNREKGLLFSHDELDKIADSGVEGDLCYRVISVMLRGHDEPIQFQVPSKSYRQLWIDIQEEDKSEEFAIFDTEFSRVAIRLSDVLYCHFLFETRPITIKNKIDNSEFYVYFKNNKKRYKFEAIPDDVDPNNPDDWGQLQLAFYEFSCKSMERINIIDVDEEYVSIRTDDITLFEVALELLEPISDEGWDDDEFE